MFSISPPLENAYLRDKIEHSSIEFKLIEFEREGLPLNIWDLKKKHIVFFLDGRATVGYNLFQPVEFSAGEVIFLPALAVCTGRTLSACTMILLSYDNSVLLYDKKDSDTISELLSQVDYRFESLPVVRTLSAFLTCMREYLLFGIHDTQMHEIKQHELFLIFTSCYSKRALVRFLYPVLGKVSDFRARVVSHCLQASSVKCLAAVSGYSERRFRQQFCAEFNEMPYDWLQKQKSKHIVMRMSQPNVLIKEVIEEFNFSSPSHFHKFCVKHYNLTPGKLIRELSLKPHSQSSMYKK